MQNIQEIANRLKELRIANGLEQTDVAAHLGYKSFTTISKWENGKNLPNGGKLAKLAELFKTSTDYILHGDSLGNTTAPQNELLTAITDKVVELDQKLKEPRHGAWISHGEALLEEQIAEQQAEEKEKAKIIPLPKTHSDTIVEEAQELKTYTFYGQATSAGTGAFMEDIDEETIDLPVDIAADFVCPVDGNSMEPDYHDGDYIFIKQAFSLNDGDIGVFDYNGNAYVKQYRIKGTRAYLHSLNPKYKDMHPSGDDTIRIIGKVVGRYNEMDGE